MNKKQQELFIDLVNHIELVIFGTSFGGTSWSEEFQKKEAIGKAIEGAIDGAFGRKKLAFPIDETNEKFSAEFKQFILDRTLQKMLDGGGIEVRKTKHAGDYFRIKNKEFKGLLAKRPSDSPAARDLRDIGPKYLVDALSNFSLSDFADIKEFDDAYEAKKETVFDEDKQEIPASNRIVSISHNQFKQVDQVTEELLDLVTIENRIDEEAGLREQILGQISAARELVRHGSVKAYLLYQTVVEVLQFLIKRYAGTAISETAKILLAVYLTNILGG